VKCSKGKFFSRRRVGNERIRGRGDGGNLTRREPYKSYGGKGRGDNR